MFKVTTKDNPKYQEFEGWGDFGETNQVLYSHNDNPSVICYFDSGKVRFKQWHLRNKFHRVNNEPCVVGYYEDGKVNYEVWYVGDKQHRDNNKPSVIGYFESGDVARREWWLDGREYSEREYYQILEQIKSMNDTEKLLDSRQWVREMVK